MNIQSFSPPWYLPNAHAETILPSLFRRVDAPVPVRTRIDTPDGDFLDCDHYITGSRICVIISHGLEGCSKQAYVTGLAKTLIDAGFDVCAWNFRGCSGEPNRTVRTYHAGVTDDLHEVVCAVADTGRYDAIHLAGFSLGGNVTLLYAAGFGGVSHPLVQKAAGVSVPVDLAGAEPAMARPANFIYMARFLYHLYGKLKLKRERFPEAVDLSGYWKIRRFAEFDDRYTAPLHGFSSAEDYWGTCGAIHHLDDISVPTLLVNAANDPFLSASCFPESRGALTVEVTGRGGHVGFLTEAGWERTFTEERLAAWFSGE